MKELFHMDGTLYTAINRFGHMVILSVLFLIGCIPIITIGTSMTALYYATVKSVRSETGYPVKEFLRAFKINLGKGSLLTVLLMTWTAVLYMNRAYMSTQVSGLALTMVMAYNVFFILTAGMMVYLFPVLSRFRMSIKGLLKLSFVMMVRYFYFTILVLIVFCAIVYLQIMFLPMATIFFVPGLYCYCLSFLIESVMKRYMPKPIDGDYQWYVFDKKAQENLEEAKWSVQK